MTAVIAGLGLVVLARAAHAGPHCQLGGGAWLEGRVTGSRAPLARSVDAWLGDTVDVFLTAPGRLDGRAVVFSESGAPRRVSWAAAGCPAVDVSWSRVEPRMQHVKTAAPNKDIAVYSNAVIFGPRHGAWLGFDRIEYYESKLDAASRAGGWSLEVRDATPTEPFARRRPAALLPFGVMRLKAEVRLATAATAGGAAAETIAATPGADDAPAGQIAARVFRYSFRRDDSFVGWLTSFFNVPYLFGSAGRGAKNQADRYLGADCADLLVAALRRAGARGMDYTSVVDLVTTLPRVTGQPADLPACTHAAAGTAAAPCAGATPTLRFGRDVQPGDLLALDYVGAEELPRAWDHIVAVIEDRGPGPDGAPDGVLGPEDLVADSGDEEGLKFAPLEQQGHVRVMVLRPPGLTPRGTGSRSTPPAHRSGRRPDRHRR
jgi:hypothetical protein